MAQYDEIDEQAASLVEDPPEPELRLKRVTITDLGPFGPQPFVIDTDAPVIIISGRNREGKTTILKVLKALHHEHDARLIRQGCAQGKAVFEYTDGTVIEHTYKHDGSERVIRHADGRVIKTGTKKEIEELASGWGLDPMMLVNEKDKQKRRKFLETVLPINFSKEEIEAKLGAPSTLRGSVDLDGFQQFVEALREKRKDKKKLVKNQEAILAQHERQVGPREEVDWPAQTKSLARELENRRAELREAISTAQAEKAFRNHKVQVALDARIAEIKAEAERWIAEQTAEARQQAQQTSDALEKAKGDAIEQAQRQHQPEIERLNREVAEAETKAKQQQQMEGVRLLIEQTREAIQAESRQADEMDEQVKACERLREEKLAQLPIKDIVFSGLDIFYQGKSFDAQLSTSEQIEVSMKICALAAGRLPVMIIDRAESLDEIREAEIIDKARRNGFQVLMTMVTRGKKLTVEKVAA
jgi:hypothetical protein